ncbi:MAG: hypothetical protein WAV27_09135 [Xanthobacteraceae bacterium]
MNAIGNQFRIDPAEIADTGATRQSDEPDQAQKRSYYFAAVPDTRRHRISRRLAASHPTPAAIVRGRLRFGLIDLGFGIPFDAYDGQNNDGRGLRAVGSSEAHDAPFVRKFDEVAHQPVSPDGRLVIRSNPLMPPSSPIKRHARLTLR